MAIFDFGICLSDLDKSKLLTDKNGKVWLNGTIVESYGELTIQEKLSKEERAEGSAYKKIGRGSVLKPKGS